MITPKETQRTYGCRPFTALFRLSMYDSRVVVPQPRNRAPVLSKTTNSPRHDSRDWQDGLPRNSQTPRTHHPERPFLGIDGSPMECLGLQSQEHKDAECPRRSSTCPTLPRLSPSCGAPCHEPCLMAAVERFINESLASGTLHPGIHISRLGYRTPKTWGK